MLLRVSAALALVGCASSGVASVGAVLGRDRDTGAVFVRDAPPGLAASDAGLVPGDEIVMVDGQYVRDLTVKELRQLLRGDVGSSVELTIVRGGEVRRVKVQRSALKEKVHEPEERMEESGDEPRADPDEMKRPVLLLAIAAFVLPFACVLGEESAPGCARDSDCEQGVCRAGACFRTTTNRSEPNDPAEAGAGDAVDETSGDGAQADDAADSDAAR